MADLAKLVVRLEAQSAQLLKELDKANGKIAQFERNTGKTLSNIDKRFAKFGFGIKAAIGTFLSGVSFNAVIQATAEAEKNFTNLENAVERAGTAAGGRTAKQFADVSEQLQRVTTFADDAIQNVQGLLLRFQNIRTDRFDEATARVLDLSTALGKDLAGASTLVGKALSDPVKGLNALAKAGVGFNEQQQKIIKNLVETGRRAEAQGLILDALGKKFGGAAEEARNNFNGALQAVRNSLGDLLEVKGGLPGATASMNELARVLQDPAVKAGADALFSLIIRLAAEAANLIGKIAAGIAVIFNKTGDRVEEINNTLEFLKDNRSLGIVNFGGKSDVNPQGGFGFLTPSEIDAQIAALEREQEIILKIGAAGAEAAKQLNAMGSADVAFELPDIEVVDRVSESAEKARKKLEDAGKALTEQFQTPLEKFVATEKRLNELLDAGVISIETWASAMSRARRELEEFNAAAVHFRDPLQSSEDLSRELTRDGLKSSDNVEQIDALLEKDLDKLDKQLEKAKKKIDTFNDQALRNIQDILADGLSTALHEGIDKGAEGALEAFGNMLEKMAFQALAANIAGKIFGTPSGTGTAGSSSNIVQGEHDWLDTILGGKGGSGGIFGFLGGLFGGSRDEGGRGRRGQPVLIGRRVQPEMFVPDGPGEFFPAEQWMGRSGGGVTQNIYTSSPITPRSARQIELEAARRQRMAVARLA
jgi:hypothetical protein